MISYYLIFNSCCERKELIDGIIDEDGISIHRACKIVCMSRSMYYYSHKKDDGIIINKLIVF